MSLDGEQRAMLRRMLEATRAEELDCDGFADNMARYVDDGIDDAALRALFEHHREICPECDEVLQTLIRALGE